MSIAVTPNLSAPVTDATRREFLAVIAASGLLAGCGAPEPSRTRPDGTRQVTDSTGRAVDIPADPQRVLVLGEFVAAVVTTLGYVPFAVVPGSTENPVVRLRGFGGLTGDLSGVQVVAGTASEINFEAIVTAGPDLIISYPNDEALDRLAAIAPTVVVDTYDSEDPLAPQRLMADVVGISDVLEARLAEYRARVDEVRAALPGNFDGLEYTLVDQYSPEDGNYVYDSPFLPAEIVLTDLGARPVAAVVAATAREASVEISIELLSGFDADVVFLATLDDRPADPAVLEVMESTSAARNDQIFQVDSNVWTFPALQSQFAVLDDLERLFTGRTIDSSGDFG